MDIKYHINHLRIAIHRKAQILKIQRFNPIVNVPIIFMVILCFTMIPINYKIMIELFANILIAVFVSVFVRIIWYFNKKNSNQKEI